MGVVSLVLFDYFRLIGAGVIKLLFHHDHYFNRTFDKVSLLFLFLFVYHLVVLIF